MEGLLDWSNWILFNFRCSTGKNSVIGEIKMILRAQRQIKEGSEVCISYISIMQGKKITSYTLENHLSFANFKIAIVIDWEFQYSYIIYKKKSMVYFFKSFLLCFDKSFFIRIRHVRHIKYRLNIKDKWYPKIYGIHKKIARICDFFALEYIYFFALSKQQLHKWF